MPDTSSPEDGFARFVAARSPALLRSAWLLTADAGKAEDLLQTVLARLWLRWHRVDQDGGVDGYARQMLYTTYLTWWRRRWRGEMPSANLPDHGDGVDLADIVAERDAVRRGLARLSRRQRAVVSLRFLDNLSVEETAELLGCSTGTPRVR